MTPMDDIDRPGAITEAVLNDAGATTPEPAYDGGNLIVVTLTPDQAGSIVYALLELSKVVEVAQQMNLSRLALGINDLIVEAQDGGAESG